MVRKKNHIQTKEGNGVLSDYYHQIIKKNAKKTFLEAWKSGVKI